MATLRVVASNDPQLQNRIWDLGPELGIGRDPANDVLVADSHVSRRHARIVSSAEGFVVSDEGSGNGVWINQQRVTRHVLTDGDILAIGDTQFRFEDPLGRATIVTPLTPPAAVAVAPPPVVVTPPAVAPVAPAAAAGSYTPAPAPAPAAAPAAYQPAPQPQPPKRTSGCAIGCLIFSIVLFLGTIAGSLFALYRAGYLPGLH